MKKTLLFSACMLMAAIGFSQTQFENPGFEGTWQTGGDIAGSEPEPIEWSSLKSADALTGFAPIVAFQETTNPHSGTYCVRLKVVNSFGVNANGLLTNGRVHADFNPDNGYVYTEDTDAKWNTPFTDMPDSLVFWVKHAPVSGDKSKVEVLLHDLSHDGELPHDGTTSHWVGKARVDITGAIGSWTRMSAPFEYFSGGPAAPTHMLAVISAGDSTIAVANTEMWIDDLELIYNPIPTVSIAPTATQNINVGVNGTTLTVTETNGTAVSRQWMVGTTTGGPYTAITPAETGTTYTPNFASAGIYYVVCETDFGSQTLISNEVEVVVVDPATNTVTVTPSAVQTILTDQNGNVLSATETPSAATTREWKVSNTSGSGYASFGTPETGLTYTPYFSALGTYYVICESDFAGDIKISNEVIINVPSSVGIDEEELIFQLFANEQTINLNFESEVEGASITFYTVEGKQIYLSEVNETSSQHFIDYSGVLIYRLVNGNRIITGKISL